MSKICVILILMLSSSYHVSLCIGRSFFQNNPKNFGRVKLIAKFHRTDLFNFFFVAPAIARCDIGIRFSVHPSVRPYTLVYTPVAEKLDTLPRKCQSYDLSRIMYI